MNRFRAYFPRDEAPQLSGDSGWLGVNMRLDPGRLPEGIAAYALNKRFSRGRAETRYGTRLMAWAHRFVGGYGAEDKVFPYGAIAGAGVFNDPLSGESWLILATSNGVYRSRPGIMGLPVDLPAGQTIPARVQLIQTYSGMVMLRGATMDPLYMTDLDEGFRSIPEATGGGSVKMPRASNGIYFQNRLFLVDSRTIQPYVDTVWVSDFGTTTDVLQGSSAYNSFKINQGSADRLVGLYRFNDTTVLALKEDSVYVISQVFGDNTELAQQARLDAVTTEYGCRAPRSVVQVGADVWFLAHYRGVVSVRQTEQNKLQGVDQPVSMDIDPLIKRIHWAAAGDSVAAFHDNKVYMAVPLDGASFNNAVLVYDTLTRQWAGLDQGDSIQVRDWIKFTYGGSIRLGFVSTDGFVYLYEDGFVDQVGGADGVKTYASIQDRLLTRGYHGGTPGQKRFATVRTSLRTWWPSTTVRGHLDGVAERVTVASSQTASRTRFVRPHGTPDYDPTNADDNQRQPWREDYSIDPATPMVTGDSGVEPDLHQETERAWRLQARGRYMQVEISNAQGRCEVAEVVVEATRGSVRMGATQ